MEGGREERDEEKLGLEASKSTFSDTPPIRLHLIIPTKELRTEHSDLFMTVRAILIQTIPRPEESLCLL